MPHIAGWVNTQETWVNITRTYNYTLRASFIGYAPLTKEVDITGKDAANINITLTVSAAELQEVVVTSAVNKFSHKESNNIARLPLKNLENPQVYSVVSANLLKEEVATDYKSAFKNIPGVNATVPLNGGTYMSMRGFYTGSYLRNGLAVQQYVGLDPINIENIEVIKGPSGTLFGSSLITFGGLVNRVTKRPFDSFKGEVSVATGSWGLGRITADINTPVNKEKTALFRINAAGNYQHSFQDYGFDRSIALAPSFSYQVNDRLSFLVDAEYYKVKRVSALYPFVTGLQAKDFSQIWQPYNKALTTDEPMIEQNAANIYTQARYQLSDKWVSTTQFAYSQAGWDQLASLWAYWLNDTTVRRAISLQRPRSVNSYNIQQNFSGEYYLGHLRNRVVAGIDFYYNTTQYQTYGLLTYDTINTKGPATALSMARINAIAAGITPTAGISKQYQYAAYVSNVINLTPELMAMLSLRVDRFDTKGTATNGGTPTGVYQQTALSPKFGLVYQLVKNQVALFANYMNGFQNVAPVVQPDGSPATFKPQQGNQWEGGVKLDVFSHKLTATLSYYNIDVSNSTRSEVRHIDGNDYTFTVQDGTQRSKGFEAEVISSPLPGLNIIAGYGYNNNRYIKANASVEGKSASAASPNIVNWWLSYSIPQGAAKGLGAGFGGNYRDASWWDAANTFSVPSLLTMDATVFYDARSWRLSLKLNNIANKKGWDLNAVPQSPRQWIGSFAVKF